MIPKYENILYATGLGSGTPYVFRHALSLAQKYDAKIHIVHSHEQLPSSAQGIVDLYIGADRVEKNFTDVVAELEKKIVDRLERLCAAEMASDSHGIERVASITVSKRSPKQAILDEAEKRHADLIIMGSHRHTALADAMLGTTTLKVLHSSTIPVLVVRIPDGYHEEGF